MKPALKNALFDFVFSRKEKAISPFKDQIRLESKVTLMRGARGYTKRANPIEHQRLHSRVNFIFIKSLNQLSTILASLPILVHCFEAKYMASFLR